MNKLVILFFGFMLSANASSGTVEVSQYFEGSNRLNQTIEPLQFNAIPIGAFKAGDLLALNIVATNKVYNDITACVATQEEAAAYATGAPCRGRQRTATPFVIQGKAPIDAKYYLILDNGYANFIKKNIVAELKYRRILSSEDSAKVKQPIQNVQSLVQATFEESDFNVFIKPCGQSNAFSDNRTANITFCSEMINEVLSQRNRGAFFGILLHEYGHSLLNKWGEPGSSEEDMADQFATVMLLRSGENGREMLQQWIKYWEAQDSRAEAANQLQNGDSHSLSIQRARNIHQNMNYPDDFVRRWNKMLYRHMTRDALVRIKNKPSRFDDLDLIQDALRVK
jgi:hypothetical protein